ncbi:MAG: hypothetical protein U9R52_02615, partial [Candidatus Omnitrophota bacterium]|nr:hypothetical protein [Candidatus Omnitrophota bacterium]
HVPSEEGIYTYSVYFAGEESMVPLLGGGYKAVESEGVKITVYTGLPPVAAVNVTLIDRATGLHIIERAGRVTLTSAALDEEGNPVFDEAKDVDSILMPGMAIAAFENVPFGNYIITAVADGYTSMMEYVAIDEDPKDIEVEMDALIPMSLVYIAVTDEYGAAFEKGDAWAKYKYYDEEEGEFYYNVHGEMNRIKIPDVPRGDFEVMVGADGYKALTYTDVVHESIEEFVVQLEREEYPPGIYEAYWIDKETMKQVPDLDEGITGVPDGTILYMHAETKGYAGEIANFSIYEAESWGGDEFITSKTGEIGDDGIVKVEWEADWLDDGALRNPPEFYFVIAAGADNRVSPEIEVFKGKLDIIIDFPDAAAFVGEDITLEVDLDAEAEFFDPNGLTIKWSIDLNGDNDFKDTVAGQSEYLGETQTGCVDWLFTPPFAWDCGVAVIKISHGNPDTAGVYAVLEESGAGSYLIEADFPGNEKYKPKTARAHLNIGEQGVILTKIELDDAEVVQNKKVLLRLNLETVETSRWEWFKKLINPLRWKELIDPNGRQIDWYIDGEKTSDEPDYIEPGTFLGTSSTATTYVIFDPYWTYGYGPGTAYLVVDTSTLSLDAGKTYHIKARFPGDECASESISYAELKVKRLKKTTMDIDTVSVKQGEPIELKCRVDAEGLFVWSELPMGTTIHWYLDKDNSLEYIGDTETLGSGKSSKWIHDTSDLYIGRHDIMAVYDGSDEFMPATGYGTLWVNSDKHGDTWVSIPGELVIKKGDDSFVIPGNLIVLDSLIDTEANGREIHWYISKNSHFGRSWPNQDPEKYLGSTTTGIGWHGNGSFKLGIGTSGSCEVREEEEWRPFYVIPKRVCLSDLEAGMDYYIKAEFLGSDELNGSSINATLHLVEGDIAGEILSIKRADGQSPLDFAPETKTELRVEVRNTSPKPGFFIFSSPTRMKVIPIVPPCGEEDEGKRCWTIEPEYVECYIEPNEIKDFIFH